MSTLKVDNLLLQNNNAGTGRILETFSGFCNGSSFTVLSGTYALETVTATQTLGTTSYVDIQGSKISYVPPAGTKTVLYEFTMQVSAVDSHAIGHFRSYIDSVEITNAKISVSANTLIQGIFTQKIPIQCNAGTNNIDDAQFTSWTALKEIKIQGRSYGTGNRVEVGGTRYWDGGATNEFIKNRLSITAIG